MYYIDAALAPYYMSVMPEKEPKMTVFNMRVSEDLVRVLDDLRRQEPDIPTRSEMARRCIEIVGRGLKTERKK